MLIILKWLKITFIVVEYIGVPQVLTNKIKYIM